MTGRRETDASGQSVLPAMAALQADLTRLIAALRRTDWSFLR